MKRLGLWTVLSAVICFLLPGFLTAAEAVIAQAQIEADFLRQQSLRERTTLTESTRKAVERGMRLADDLHQRGVTVDAEAQHLWRIGDRLRQLPAGKADETARKLYIEARCAVRKLALRNPLLDFDAIVFVKHGPGRFPAHVRPVLRLVVAAGRRRVRPGGLQERRSRSSAA